MMFTIASLLQSRCENSSYIHHDTLAQNSAGVNNYATFIFCLTATLNDNNIYQISYKLIVSDETT